MINENLNVANVVVKKNVKSCLLNESVFSINKYNDSYYLCSSPKVTDTYFIFIKTRKHHQIS